MDGGIAVARFGAIILCGLMASTLAACGSGGGNRAADPAKAAAARRAAVSLADPRMPGNFPIYVGQSGQVREFRASDAIPGQPGRVISYSVIGRPDIVRDFYEDHAETVGMTVEGRVSSVDFMSVDARRTATGSPRTFSAMAVKKGEYTNVTLQFDVVP